MSYVHTRSIIVPVKDSWAAAPDWIWSDRIYVWTSKRDVSCNVRLWAARVVKLTCELTFFVAQVWVKPLRLEHDEERPPPQQHSREEQVLDDGSDRHPPASGEGGGQGWSHGWRGETEDKQTKKRSGEQRWRSRGKLGEWREPSLTAAQNEGRRIIYLWREKCNREGGVGDVVTLSGKSRRGKKLLWDQNHWGELGEMKG